MERKDVNINSKSRYGETPLWRAAQDGSIEIVRLLLDRPDIEINFQYNKESPLSPAAKKSNLDIFKL
jgi:ankyrin repeat protein